MWSFLLSIFMVMAFMVLYYNGSGWVANVALLANIFILLGTLASIQASLTLPGIYAAQAGASADMDFAAAELAKAFPA